MRVKENSYGKKWIGKSYPTLLGRLRYWYYKKRGWVQGNFWYKPHNKEKGQE